MRFCLGGWQLLCSLLIYDDAGTIQEVLRLTSGYQSERRPSASRGVALQESLWNSLVWELCGFHLSPAAASYEEAAQMVRHLPRLGLACGSRL